jgi:trimeric autotransporter adhesin
VLPTADGMRLNALTDLTVRLADGHALPTWLHYDAATGELSGVLPAHAHDVRVVVLQRDAAGHVTRNEVVLAPSGAHPSHHASHQAGHSHAHPVPHASRNALTHVVERATGQAPLPAGKPSLAQQFASARAALHVVRPAAAATAAVATAAAPEYRA